MINLSDYKNKYLILYLYAIFLFITGFAFNTPDEIVNGLNIICVSSASLVTDYMKLANIGAALVNSSIVTLFSIMIMNIRKINLRGIHIAAVFVVSGFSLFGKNLLNSMPLMFGVIAFTRLYKIKIEDNIANALFVTSLAPMVTNVYLLVGGVFGVVCAFFAGFLVGFIFTPLLKPFKEFHKGFNLYNGGFTAGIIAMFYSGFLKTINIELPQRHIVLSGYNDKFLPLLLLLSMLFIILGLCEKNALINYFKLLKRIGPMLQNYEAEFGSGACLINAGTLGIISTLYVILVGGELNGPIIGGILTIMGFAFIGKDIRNALPIFLGIYVASLINVYNPHDTALLLASLFGTTLCPISNYYGSFAGFLAGFLHMALINNVGGLHAGLNLYNNGFSGGFIAAFMVPLLDTFYKRPKYLQVKKEE